MTGMRERESNKYDHTQFIYGMYLKVKLIDIRKPYFDADCVCIASNKVFKWKFSFLFTTFSTKKHHGYVSH